MLPFPVFNANWPWSTKSLSLVVKAVQPMRKITFKSQAYKKYGECLTYHI